MIDYDESPEKYHANAALGSTDICDFLRSPRLFRDRQDGIRQKETPSLLFGTATHMALLEPGRFARLVAIRPETYTDDEGAEKKWNGNATACRHWVRQQERLGKVVVTTEQHEALRWMHDRMPSEVRAIFAASRHEVTIRTKLDDIDVQCRLDIWQQGVRWADLKTIDDIANVERAIYKYSYHIKLAWYSRVLAAETGASLPSSLIFAEKQPPYRWRIVELDPDYQALADQAIDDALHGIRARMKSGDWSDPEDLRLIASPPAWLTDQLDLEEV